MLPSLSKGSHQGQRRHPHGDDRAEHGEQAPTPSGNGTFAALWSYENTLKAACSYATSAPKIVTGLQALDDPTRCMPALARAMRVWSRSVSNTVVPRDYEMAGDLKDGAGGGLLRHQSSLLGRRGSVPNSSGSVTGAGRASSPQGAPQRPGLLFRGRSISVPEADMASILQLCRSAVPSDADDADAADESSRRESSAEVDGSGDGTLPSRTPEWHLPSIERGPGRRPAGLFRQRSLSCDDAVHAPTPKTLLQQQLSLLHHVALEDDIPTSEVYRRQCVQRLVKSRLSVPAWQLAHLKLLGAGIMLPKYESENDYVPSEATLDSFVSRVRDLGSLSSSAQRATVGQRPVVTDTKVSQYRNMQAKSAARRI